jgi:branched-subunit amino acid transport protein AzlD
VWTVTINNPVVGALGTYVVKIGQTLNVTAPISMFASGSAFASAFASYYNKYFSTSISAVLVMYDIAGAVTIVDADSVKNIYTVTTTRLLNEKSFANLIIVQATAASFVVTL